VGTESETESLMVARIAKRLSALEARRRTLVRDIIVVTTALVLIDAVLIVKFALGAPRLLHVLLLGGGMVIVGAYSWLKARYVKDFKDLAIARMVDQLGPGLQYRHKGLLGQRSFEKSGLFPGKIIAYTGEDLVWGEMYGLEFGFCELAVKHHTRFAIAQDTRELRCMFLEATIPRLTKAPVVIVPAAQATDWERQAKKFAGKGAALPMPVPLPPGDFATCFAVRAVHPPDVRRLLTQQLRTSLMALQERAGGGAHVAFVRDKFFVAVPSEANLLEPPVFRPVTDSQALTEHFRLLQRMTGLLEDVAGLAALGAPTARPQGSEPAPMD
jgi:hypothetical protein